MSATGDQTETQPDIEEYLNSLKASRKFGPQVVCHRVFPAVDRDDAPGQPNLSPHIREILRSKGIERLYSHQTEAIGDLLDGKDILVATPTASGKSMIYNLPVLDLVCSDEPGYALYLFPLKALAQDQLRVLKELAAMLPQDMQKSR